MLSEEGFLKQILASTFKFTYFKYVILYNQETSFPNDANYLVRYNDKICTLYFLVWRGFRTEFEVTGLGAQECYQFRLKVITAEGEGPWSPQVAATTKGNIYLYW